MSDIHAIYPSSKDIIELVENDLADGVFHDGSGFPYIRAISEDFVDRWDGRHEEDEDELVQRLFDLSLHCEIYKTEPMYWATDSCGEPCLFGLLVRVRECKGATNITPNVIEAVADILSPYQPPKMTTWAWGYS